MYVSRQTLMTLFSSSLARILRAAGEVARPEARAGYGGRTGDDRSALSVVASGMAGAFVPALQSTAGNSRFLGVSVTTGECNSVGRDRSPDDWVVWRSFLSELPVACVPGAETTEDVVSVPRVGVLAALVDVCDLVQALHSEGLVHGDLKPDNILLLADGPQLIDSFDVPVGAQAPGFTAAWSAPEQRIGVPVSAAADVYPIAQMVRQVIGAHLVGELTRVRTIGPEGVPTTIEYLKDPVPARSPHTWNRIDAVDDFEAWRHALARALRSDPSTRTGTAGALRDDICRLLTTTEVSGSIVIPLTGQPVQARTSTGVVAARLVQDPAEHPHPGPAGPSWKGTVDRITDDRDDWI
jgi:hypothetical protein